MKIIRLYGELAESPATRTEPLIIDFAPPHNKRGDQ